MSSEISIKTPAIRKFVLKSNNNKTINLKKKNINRSEVKVTQIPKSSNTNAIRKIKLKIFRICPSIST